MEYHPSNSFNSRRVKRMRQATPDLDSRIVYGRAAIVDCHAHAATAHRNGSPYRPTDQVPHGQKNGRARRPWPAGRARRAVPAAHRAAYRAICPGLDADLGPTHNCGLQTPEDYGLNTDTTADRLGYGLTTDKSFSPYLLQASSTATRFWCGASGAHVNSTDCVRLTRASLRSLFSNPG